MSNPYQPPSVLETQVDDRRAVLTIADRFNATQQTALGRGLRMATWGQMIMAPCALILIASFFIIQARAYNSLYASLACIGWLIALRGYLSWCTLPGRQRVFVIVGLVLQVIAVVAISSFLIAVFNGRFVGGLFVLFGASAFAMLLTSQAIMVLVNRLWASSLQDRVAVYACELAVIAYAICASVCAANAMRMLPKPGQFPTVIVAAFVFGTAASTLHMIAYQRTLRSFRAAKHD